MAKVDVKTETIVERPTDDVASFAMDPDNAPVWYDNIKSVEWKTTPPLAVGSQIAFVAHFLGRRLAYTYEVTIYEPGVRFVMRTSEGPFPMETTYEWESVGPTSTKMTLRNRGETAGFSTLVKPLMATMMARANQKDLAKLKSILEAD